MEGNTSNNNGNIMGQVMTIFLDSLKKQGPSFLLLLAFIFGFLQKYEALEAKVEQCNKIQMEMYQGQINYLNTVISENTKAMNRNTDMIRYMGRGKEPAPD